MKDDNASIAGPMLAVSMVVFLLGANLGWSLHVSTNPDGSLGIPWDNLITRFFDIATLVVTITYVVLTYRLSQSATRDSAAAQDSLKVAEETLALYREQYESETQPLLFANIESISGKKGAMRLDDVQVAVYNFSKQPIFVRYGDYSFDVEDNRKMYFQTDKFHQLNKIGHEILQPFSHLTVPHISKPLFSDKPTFNLYFVYEGVDYKFSAHVPYAGNINEQKTMRWRPPF